MKMNSKPVEDEGGPYGTAREKLSDAELDIMLAIWQSPPPVQRADLEEQLQSHNWADTTLLTLLSKLVEKGYLSVERQGRHNLYRPLVSEADYRRWANRSFWGRCTSPPFAAWWRPWWKAGT